MKDKIQCQKLLGFELSGAGEGLAAENGFAGVLLDLEVSTVVLRGVLGLGEEKGRQPEPCLWELCTLSGASF